MGESLVFFAACGAIVAIGVIVKFLLNWIDLATGNDRKKKKLDYTQHLSDSMRKQARFYGNTFRDGYNNGRGH